MRSSLGVLLTLVVLACEVGTSYAADWNNGTVSLSWELSPPSAAARGKQISATAACNYNANMAAGKEWEYGSPSVSFEWQYQPDGSAVGNASDTATGGAAGSLSYKSQRTILYNTASRAAGDKTVKVRAHVTGTITDYGPDGEKGTADDIPYTVDQWSDWLAANLTVFDIFVCQSDPVFADGSPMAIAAGGGAIDSQVHRATLSVMAHLSGYAPLSGVELEFTITSEDHKEVAPAFVGGSCVTTDADGWADGIVLSGDAVCEIVIEVAHDGQVLDTISVFTEEGQRGDELWSFDPPYLLGEGSTSDVSIHLLRSGDGEPIDGHGLVFMVDSVKLRDGQTVTENLAGYAFFSGNTLHSDSLGSATDTLTAGSEIEQCEIIYIAVEDQDVWKRGSPLHKVRRDTAKHGKKAGIRLYKTNTLDEVLDWTDIKLVPQNDDKLYVGLVLEAESQAAYDALPADYSAFGYRVPVDEYNLPPERPDLKEFVLTKWKYDANAKWAWYHLKDTPGQYGSEAGLPVTYFGNFDQERDGTSEFFGIDNAHISAPFGDHEPNMYYWGEKLLAAGLRSRGIAHPRLDSGSNDHRKAVAGARQNGGYETGRPQTSDDLEFVRSGGVEKIVLTLRNTENDDTWKYPGIWLDMTHVLVKNQADIFLVSGHGNHSGYCEGDYGAKFKFRWDEVGGHWNKDLKWLGMALCWTADYDGGIIGCAANTLSTPQDDTRPGLEWARLVIGDLQGHGVFGFAGYGWSGRDYQEMLGQDFGEELFGTKLQNAVPVATAWLDSWAPNWASFAKTAKIDRGNGKSKWPAAIVGKRGGAGGYFTNETAINLEDVASDTVNVTYVFRMDGYAQMYTQVSPFETYSHVRGEGAPDKNREMSRQSGVWDEVSLSVNRPLTIVGNMTANGNVSPVFKSGGDNGACTVVGAVTLSWSAPGHPDNGTRLADYEVQVFREDLAAANRDWPIAVRGPDLTKAAEPDAVGLVGSYFRGNAEQPAVTIAGLEAGKRYFWRVRAKDEKGKWGHWSAFRFFDTGNQGGE